MVYVSAVAKRDDSLGWAMFALGIAVNLTLVVCSLAVARTARFEVIEILNIHAAGMREQFLPGIVYILNVGLIIPFMMLYRSRLSEGGERLFAVAGISYLIGQFVYFLFVYTYWLTMGSAALSVFREPLHCMYVLSFAAALTALGYLSMGVDIVCGIEKWLIRRCYALMDGLVRMQ